MLRPVLYSFASSSAAWRARAALALCGVPHDTVEVDLRAGAQHAPEYVRANPEALVPMLAFARDGGASASASVVRLTQSLAILEAIDDPIVGIRPNSNSADAADAEPMSGVSLFRRHGAPELQLAIRSFCLHIACDVHPLNNLRVLKYLKDTLHADAQARSAWYAHWIQAGFGALECSIAASHVARTGDTLASWAGVDAMPPVYALTADLPSAADCLLVPQVFNAWRNRCDLRAFPWIRRAVLSCVTPRTPGSSGAEDGFVRTAPPDFDLDVVCSWLRAGA